MFNTKRKITRKKVYPFGDYLYDKYLGLKSHTIKEDYDIWGGYVKIEINFVKDADIINIDILQMYINFIKKLQEIFNLKYSYNISLHSSAYENYIEFFLSDEDTKKIINFPDYNDWFKDAKEKAKEFDEKRKMKKNMKKYNI